MAQRSSLTLLCLGLSVGLGLLTAGERQVVLDVESFFVREAAKYAISKITCPCAATHDDSHEHHQLELRDIKSAMIIFGKEEDLMKIDGHIHSEHESGTHAHECTFYLNIRNRKVVGLKEYTCSKFPENLTKDEDFEEEELQLRERKELENFAKPILAKYHQELKQILTATKKYDEGVTYILRLLVNELNEIESKSRECIMSILYEPWKFYKYSVITDSCHQKFSATIVTLNILFLRI